MEHEKLSTQDGKASHGKAVIAVIGDLVLGSLGAPTELLLLLLFPAALWAYPSFREFCKEHVGPVTALGVILVVAIVAGGQWWRMSHPDPVVDALRDIRRSIGELARNSADNPETQATQPEKPPEVPPARPERQDVAPQPPPPVEAAPDVPSEAEPTPAETVAPLAWTRDELQILKTFPTAIETGLRLGQMLANEIAVGGDDDAVFQRTLPIRREISSAMNQRGLLRCAFGPEGVIDFARIAQSPMDFSPEQVEIAAFYLQLRLLELQARGPGRPATC